MQKAMLFILPLLLASCDSPDDEALLVAEAQLVDEKSADLADEENESLEISVRNKFAIPNKPSAQKKTCCFKCFHSGWYSVKLNTGCNHYAKGFCQGKHHSKVKHADWSNDCAAD